MGPTDFELDRREYLVAGAATLFGLAGMSGSAAGRGDDSEHDHDAGRYAPVPETARGPEIPEKGYLVEELGEGLYYITEGVYQVMFVTTGEGVIVVDAPPTIGENVLNAIEEVTDESITHVVYSHYHADHIGAASLYPDDAEVIAYERTAETLAQFDDPNRPQPTTTFDGSYVLEVGDQRLELDFRGANHTPDNIFVYAPDQQVLMFVDVIFPGWVPFKNLAISQDIPGYIEAHDQVLEYDFETFIGGHLTRLGTREDVRIQREFIGDLRGNVREGIETIELGPVVEEVGAENPWVLFDAYLNAIVEQATDETLDKWLGELGGADVFTASHAFVMLEALRVDYGILGPFGLPGE